MPASSQSFFSDTDWTVPKYVDIVRITCEGGAGGDASASSDSADGFQNCSKGAGGGNGGRAKGDLTTSPGETLYIRRNSGGSGGSAGGYATSANSGAGGDGTDVRQNGSTEGYIQIAAGGVAGAGQQQATLMGQQTVW